MRRATGLPRVILGAIVGPDRYICRCGDICNWGGRVQKAVETIGRESEPRGEASQGGQNRGGKGKIPQPGGD